jgi:solute carrier family 25 (mitochondrial oxoglutarate transporter), member 11
MSSNNNDTTSSSLCVPSPHVNNDIVISLPTRMVLSAFSGMGAAIFCHPLDVIRVQMQTTITTTTTTTNSSQALSPSTWNTAITIYRTAGFFDGLYAGISAAFLRQWLYGSFRMGIYSYLLEREQMKNRNYNNNTKSDKFTTTSGDGNLNNTIPFATKLGLGCISGGIGSLVGTPSEVALIRMSADSNLPPADRRRYTGVINCLSRIAKEEGVRMWWRGATPTVVRATLLGSASMGVTSQAKSELISTGYFGHNGQWAGGLPLLFCATLVSSFFANVVANPFDVIKSRLQNMVIPTIPNQRPMYNGMMDCFIQSIKAEGVSVLWAGFVPAFIKLAPYSVISLTLLDKLTKAVTGRDAF